jgi:hypothetical protein
MEKELEGCPLDHSSYEKYTSCDCNFGTAHDCWDFKQKEIDELNQKIKDGDELFNKMRNILDDKMFLLNLNDSKFQQISSWTKEVSSFLKK